MLNSNNNKIPSHPLDEHKENIEGPTKQPHRYFEPKKQNPALRLILKIVCVFVASIAIAYFIMSVTPYLLNQADNLRLKINNFTSKNHRQIEENKPATNQQNPEQPPKNNQENQEYKPQTSQEAAVINAVKNTSPAVVSIIITKDVPVYEQYYESPFPEMPGFPDFEFQVPQYRQKGTEKKEVGGGTGFIVSSDGMIITNKHVVYDEQAEYTAITNDGKKYSVEVLARDPVQDIAIVKIKNPDKKFKTVKLGDSSNLQIGQSVIAIGNALGEFRNTVSVGVISGLGRTITASGEGMAERLENVIQTDAAINRGNSGGPLLNLRGEVIGVNVAMAQLAQNIGFAVPINVAKRDIKQVKTEGKITYPFLGVRYALITPELKKEKNLPVDNGALVLKGEKENEPAVVPDSAADKAGIKQGDIILKIDNQRVTINNSLAKIIQRYKPGDRIQITVLRNGKEIELFAVLGKRESNQ